MKKTQTKKNETALKAQAAYEWFVKKYQKQGYSSMSQFADEVGLQKSTLSRYFHLQRQIPSNTIGKLCKELNVKPAELLTAIGALD